MNSWKEESYFIKKQEAIDMLTGVHTELQLDPSDDDYMFLEDLKLRVNEQPKPLILFQHDPEHLKLSISSFDEI